jgi:hypothetical protein
METIDKYTTSPLFRYAHFKMVEVLNKNMQNGSLDAYEYCLTNTQLNIASEMLLRKDTRPEALHFIGVIIIVSQNVHSTQRAASNETTAYRICEQMCDAYGEFDSPKFSSMLTDIIKLLVDYVYELDGTNGLLVIYQILFAFR